MLDRLTIILIALAVCLIAVAPAQASKLTLSKAKAAAQKTADQFAGQPTKITTLLKTSERSYYGQAQWEKPGEFFPQSCFAELTIKLPRGKPNAKATVDSFACF